MIRKGILHKIGPPLSILLFAAALAILHHALRDYHYREVVRTLRALPHSRILLSFLLTILGYAALTGYDSLAFRYIGHPLKYGRIALASFIGYAFSNNMGHSILTGSSVRLRLYTDGGVSTIQIGRVVAFCVLTLWLGVLMLGGVVFVLEPVAIPSLLYLPFSSARPLGVILLFLVGVYLAWIASRRKPLRLGEWELPIPGLKLSLAQIAVSALDWGLAGAVLYVLLPPTPGLTLPGFLAIYLLGQLAGLVSQVPGGLGVFETVCLLLLQPRIPPHVVIGALVAYRVIYYLVPLAAAAVLLAIYEVLQRKAGAARVLRIFGQWVPRIVPNVLAFTTFLSGAILLFSGATPAIHSRLAWLNDFLPLPVLEISHFLGSLAGVSLLLLAHGLSRRLDGAYHLTVILLGAGMVFSLLKGADYEEAITLAIMLGALIPCRKHFYRKASIMNEPFTPGWIVGIVLVLLSALWLGFFSYKHVDYSHDLWWTFELKKDAPRFLRDMVGVLGLTFFIAVRHLLRPAPPEPALPGRKEMAKALAIVQRSPSTSANLALLGDKAFLFSDSGNAFIMYGVRGRSWVAMGDPVGPESEWAELLWRFRELSDRHDAWPVFYEVQRANLHLYLDLGLTLLKLGEEARVKLEKFSLEGGHRKGMRYLRNNLENQGVAFTVVPVEGVPALLPELRGVSDAWLAEKNTREKGFSLGYFDENYLKYFPAAVVRHKGRIVAFANVWLGAEKEELSPDLMRFHPEAPENVMEYLFIALMLWGKAEGYRWFNLGMAPLSGLQNRALAPLWNRLGALVFRFGENFYNFRGLRQYKQKFDPAWEPKYLASPGGLALPRILAATGALISGGLKGVVAK